MAENSSSPVKWDLIYLPCIQASLKHFLQKNNFYWVYWNRSQVKNPNITMNCTDLQGREGLSHWLFASLFSSWYLPRIFFPASLSPRPKYGYLSSQLMSGRHLRTAPWGVSLISSAPLPLYQIVMVFWSFNVTSSHTCARQFFRGQLLHMNCT